VRLVCLGDAKLGLWRLADSYPAAQTEVLGALPKLAAPLLSLASLPLPDSRFDFFRGAGVRICSGWMSWPAQNAV